MNRKYLLSTLTVVSLAVNTNAKAGDDSGFYLGLSVGEATDKVDGFDESGVFFKALGGYAFNMYFAAEAAYVDAGEIEDTVEDLDVAIESSGISVAALGKLPLGTAVSLFAKLGYVFYDEEVNVRQGALSYSDKNSAEDLLYGAGAEVELGRSFQLRAEYEVVDVSNADFDMISLGATFRF